MDLLSYLAWMRDLVGFLMRNLVFIVVGIWLFLAVATPLPKELWKAFRHERDARKAHRRDRLNPPEG